MRIRNLRVHGFERGLAATDCSDLRIEECDFSDNYHDPDFGWGDGDRDGGIIWTRVGASAIVRTKANRVWNGLDLWECHDNLVEKSDLSHCSNVCLKLWNSCRNRILDTDLSWGIRISPGEVHARDSTCVLIESGSDGNRFERNDIRHGGDGVFIRPLNGWVSTGNVFVENDCSYANNNGFESWAPGNTFLRNRANHCSFGFWLGGSDRSVIVGNEASFNGLPTGNHNAEEPDFVHGGIVIVGGQGHHSVIEGNRCIGNNGAGIVFRGDLPSDGKRWRMENIVVQRNILEKNRWGVFARFTDGLFLSSNVFRDNAEKDELLEDVTDLRRGAPDPRSGEAPRVVLAAPEKVLVGEEVVLDASASSDPLGRELQFFWRIGGRADSGARLRRVFEAPGFHRVSLLVTNGHLAGVASRDLYAVRPVTEIGTEGGVDRWTLSRGYDPQSPAILGFPFPVAREDSPLSLVGGRSLCLRAVDRAEGTFVAELDAPDGEPWNLTTRTRASFWIRASNANNWGFQGAGPILRLHSGKSAFAYIPARGGLPIHLLRDLPHAEARYGWLHVELPLSGSPEWIRMETLDGVPPPHVDACLRFETVETPFAAQGDCALASAGSFLFCFVRDDDALWKSEDGRTWTSCRAPAEALGAPGGNWENGMLAVWRGPKGDDVLVSRRREASRDDRGENPPRYVLYDIAADSWRWTRTYATAGHGLVTAGGRVFGIAHAVGGNYGGPLTRFDPAAEAPFDDRSVVGGLRGNEGKWWFSRAAKLVLLGSRIHGIKNDWITPAPTEEAKGGDRLFAFDPDAYRPSEFAGGFPWDEAKWKAAETPAEDLGVVPLEPGHGAALVALPPSWSPDIGKDGGLLVVAGCSPSNNEGFGPPSDLFALWDAGTGRFVSGRLPGPTGSGTAAALHAGRVFIQRGGTRHDPSDRQLWIVQPLGVAEASEARRVAERERMRLDRVDRLSLQIESAGPLPWTVWIDGLAFE